MRNVIIFGLVPALCAFGGVWVLFVAGIPFGGTSYWPFRGYNVLLAYWGLDLLFVLMILGLVLASRSISRARRGYSAHPRR